MVNHSVETSKQGNSIKSVYYINTIYGTSKNGSFYRNTSVSWISDDWK